MGLFDAYYIYDKLGRVVECIYPDNSSIKQTYNPFFLIKIERIQYEVVVYDNKLDKFDLSGKPGKIDFPKNSGTLALKYDLLNRPLSLTSKHYEEKEIVYDARGLLISKNVNNHPQSYDHDHLQQLTLEQTEQYSHTYENDALNRQVKVDGLDQIHNSVQQLRHGIHGEYQFDDKGRRIQDSDIKFIYDRFDRLVKVKKGKSTWCYTYDAFNRKMSRTFFGKTIDYLYDGHEEIGSYGSNKQNLDLKILSACEGSIPIAIELGNETYAPLISSQGHIVGLVEAETGNLSNESFVTMFGEDLSANPLSPWRFCGKRHETSELGIIDFGFRFYHPKSAQWLTQDPLGESDGPNLYAYVRNNPTCYVDRFGLFLDDFSFSNSWKRFKDNCSSGMNEISETGYTRFQGITRAGGGLTECVGGAAIAGGGSAFTLGSGAPLAVPVGSLIMLHGADNFIAGCNQFLTGRVQKTLSAQLLEKGGASSDVAEKVNDGLMLTFAIAGTAKVGLNSGLKYQKTAFKGLSDNIDKTEQFTNRGISLAGSQRTPLEYASYQEIRNHSAFINGRSYSGHALDRMQDRGIWPSVVENTISTGMKTFIPGRTNSSGTFKFYEKVNNNVVILNQKGGVITTRPGR